MVSLKDIANACGVSVATVSKALNNHNDISPEKKQFIRQTAKDMGYVTNAAAQALKTNRTQSIGVLFVDGSHSGLTHDYFSNVLDSFKRVAEREGYDITFISNDRTRPGRTSYLEHARFRRFDGVVVACVDFTDPEVIELISSDIPTVTIDHSFHNCTAILSDNADGMRALVERAFDYGHTKVAYVHGIKSNVTDVRLVTFYKVAEERGIEIPDEYIKESQYRDTTTAYQKTLELLDLPNPPTCIFYPDDYASYGGLRAFIERNIRVPEDISIVGYDGLKIARHIRPRLTTWRQDTEELGAQAAYKLIELIEHPKTTLPETVMVNGTIFEGDTLRNLNI